MTKAVVREIQIGGLTVVNTPQFSDLVKAFDWDSTEIIPMKVAFTITLPNGRTKHLTIRQETDCMIVYGDFDGLPSFLDYAQSVIQEEDLERAQGVND